MQRLAATAYWIALLAWFTALVAAAATAMAAFGNLPELGISMPAADAVYPPGSSDAGRFVAGFVAQPVFDAAATVMWCAVPATAILAILQRSVLHWPGRSWPNRFREWLLGAAVVLAFLHLAILAPRMRTALGDYRSAVLQGDAISAAALKQGFDADHRKADPLLRTTSFLLLGSIALSAWTMTPRRAGSRPDFQGPRFTGRS